MKTIQAIKNEINEEVNLTLDFFAKLDQKAKEQKEISERVEKLAIEQQDELLAIFNQIAN
ncbi:hypothetical protein [Pedobacter sp.]